MNSFYNWSSSRNLLPRPPVHAPPALRPASEPPKTVASSTPNSSPRDLAELRIRPHIPAEFRHLFPLPLANAIPSFPTTPIPTLIVTSFSSPGHPAHSHIRPAEIRPRLLVSPVPTNGHPWIVPSMSLSRAVSNLNSPWPRR